MVQKDKGGVTRRGLLWAGGLAAVPLPPIGAYDLQAKGLPWEGARADHPVASRGVTKGAPNERKEPLAHLK